MKEGYKDSVLGEIPVVWKIEQLKNTSNQEKHSFIDGDWIESPYISDSGIRLIQTGNIGIGNFIDKNKKHISESSFIELKCKEVIEGDILICRLAAPVGRACIVPNLGTKNITSVDVTICRPNINVNKVYLINYLNFQPTLNRMENLSGGSTRQRINRTNLGKIEIPIPPLPEQQKIAEILSTVDAKIEIIDQQISETQELKKGLMQQLLTKGIGHTEFKDSVLGKIPKSWEVRVLREECERLNVGFVGACEKFYCEKGKGILMIRTGNLSNGKIRYTNLKYVTHEFHNKNIKSQIFEGDLLIARHGSSGQAVLVPKSFQESNCLNIIVIRPKSSLNSEFLKFQFNSNIIKEQVRKKTAGSTQGVVNTKEIASLKILYPTISEQQQISEILSSVDDKLEVLSEKKTTYQELKQGLMQQLLTGKVRV
jgi:type I restriction enzyme S subunit